jgi:hypothetical protein
MATISIADNDARIQHSIGSGGNTANSTTYAIDFPFFALDDIDVTITTAAGVDTVLSRGSGAGTFAVSGTSVDDGFSGGSITLGSVYTSVTVTITRDIPIARTSDFATSGPFNISSLNTELDKVYAVMQQIETNNNRSLTMPDSDSLTAITLPGQTARLGTVLGFNASTGQAEVGPTIANVNSLSAITANINTVGGIAANVTTVAGISANVTTVAGISSNVSSVVSNASNINSAVSNASNINTVAGAISNVNTVSGAISNVNSVAGNASNINTVAGKASLITADFASDMALIDSTFVSKINLVTSDFVTDMAVVTSDFIADLNSLATTDIIADLDLLATSDFISDLNAVEGIKANVTTVAGISSNVTSVAGNATNINLAVSNASNINSAVSNASNINSAVGNASNINSAVSNATNINTVAGAISNVNTVGGAITNVNTVATNIASVNNFAEVYRIDSSAPTTSLNVGDLYFDTTSDILKVYGASGWQSAGSSVNGTSQRYHYDIGGAVTSVTGSDANGNTLAYDAGYVDVYVNGVRMSTADVTVTSGDTVTFTEALASGDEVDIVGYGTFAVASLNADNLDSGTVPIARLAGSYTGITGTGALNTGSITSGFGAIDNGASAITTTGVGSFGSLDISGDIDVDGTTNLDVVDIDGAVDMASTLQVDGAITSSSTIAATRAGADQNILGEATTAGYASRLQLKAANYSGGSYNGIQSFQGDVTPAWEISGAQANATNVMRLATGGAERMRLDSSGNVFVGKTSANLGVVGYEFRTNSAYFTANSDTVLGLNRTGSDGNSLELRNDGTIVGTISISGSSTSYNTSSDYRLKENVVTDWDATTRLKQLKPSRFNFIAHADTTVDGFLAHEVQEIVPEAISGTKDAMTAEVLYVDGDDIPDGKVVGDVKTASQINPQGIDQSKLVPLLVKTIQELEARITALEGA